MKQGAYLTPEPTVTFVDRERAMGSTLDELATRVKEAERRLIEAQHDHRAALIEYALKAGIVAIGEEAPA